MMEFLYNLIGNLIHGKERIRKAKSYCAILKDSTCNLGSFGYNYNQQGEMIRKQVSPRAIDRRHPLEIKYNSK